MALLRAGTALAAFLALPAPLISGDQNVAHNSIPPETQPAVEVIGHLPAPRVAPPGEQPPILPIRHLEDTADGWSVAETEHFRIYHHCSRETVENVAAIAEQARTGASVRWLGAPEDWERRCKLYLYAGAVDLARESGAQRPPAGFSQIETEDGRVTDRKIEVHCEQLSPLKAVVAHEVTHVVLAGHFGGHGVPRWADEGMAVLAEPRAIVERHLRNLARHREELFDLRALCTMDYPEPRGVEIFYGQSVSLVKFLTNRKGSRAFTRFLQDGQRNGYEPALERAYDYRDFGQLQREWTVSAFGESAARFRAP